jgi:hypothetical protein
MLSSATAAFHVYHAASLVFRAKDTTQLAWGIEHWLLCTQSSVSVLSGATAIFNIYHTIGFVLRAKYTT